MFHVMLLVMFDVIVHVMLHPLLLLMFDVMLLLMLHSMVLLVVHLMLLVRVDLRLLLMLHSVLLVIMLDVLPIVIRFQSQIRAFKRRLHQLEPRQRKIRPRLGSLTSSTPRPAKHKTPIRSSEDKQPSVTRRSRGCSHLQSPCCPL